MPTLLVIDDSAPVRKAVRDGLSQDMQVLEAENGLKAIEALESNSVDVILLDCVMPVMDGPTTLRVIRSRGHRMPVILLTSETKTSRIASMLALGAQQFMAKPMRIDELRRKVAAFVAPSPADVVLASNATTAYGMPPPPVAYKRIAVLLVDGNEKAVSRFWEAVPHFVNPQSCADLAAALVVCQQNRFRAVILDAALLKQAPPDALKQLRALQPNTTFIGVFLRTTADKDEVARMSGLDSGLYKPFVPEEVQSFMEGLAGVPVTLDVYENMLTPRPYPQDEEKQRIFTEQLHLELLAAIDAAAEASHLRVWLHVQHSLPHSVLSPIATDAMRRCQELGLEFGIVDSAGAVAAMAAPLAAVPIRIVQSLDEID